MLVHFTQVVHGTRVDLLHHAVEIDQKTQEDFITGGTVFVYAQKIAQYCYAGHILSVKGQDTV